MNLQFVYLTAQYILFVKVCDCLMTESVLWKRCVKVGKFSDSGCHLQFLCNLLSLIDDKL